MERSVGRAFNEVIRMAAEQDLDVVLTTHKQDGEDERLRAAPIVRVRIRQRKLMGSPD